ncbi:unnamed protein product [Leptosia nina]|uniref:Uncharacterized protein n=1 Tax=Leptosia nina TaxID=320188 RepID=A0AAV1K0I9_9NEOP
MHLRRASKTVKGNNYPALSEDQDVVFSNHVRAVKRNILIHLRDKNSQSTNFPYKRNKNAALSAVSPGAKCNLNLQDIVNICMLVMLQQSSIMYNHAIPEAITSPKSISHQNLQQETAWLFPT